MPHKKEKKIKSIKASSNGASKLPSASDNSLTKDNFPPKKENKSELEFLKVDFNGNPAFSPDGFATDGFVQIHKPQENGFNSSEIKHPDKKDMVEEAPTLFVTSKVEESIGFYGNPAYSLDSVAKINKQKENGSNSLETKHGDKKDMVGEVSKLFVTNKVNDSIPLHSPDGVVQIHQPKENSSNSLELKHYDKKDMIGESSGLSETNKANDSIGPIESGLDNGTCIRSIDSLKRADQVCVLRNKYYKLYGKKPRGGYQNLVWWLEQKINEMESNLQEGSNEKRNEATRNESNNLDPYRREDEADTGGDQMVDLTDLDDEIKPNFTSGEFGGSEVFSLPDGTIQSDSQFSVPTIKRETDENKEEILLLRKKYLEVFDMDARGPYQNKSWWLKSRIANLDPKEAKETAVLRKKYYSKYGHQARGNKSYNIEWLKSKLVEVESLEQAQVEDTKTLKVLPAVKGSSQLPDTTQLQKKRKRIVKIDALDAGAPSSNVTAKDVAECIIAAQAAMEKSATDPGVMENLSKAAELIAKKQYPQLMVSTGQDGAIEKFSFKGAVTVNCGNCKQSNTVKFKFNS